MLAQVAEIANVLRAGKLLLQRLLKLRRRRPRRPL